MSTFKPTFLYIKQHSITGLLYFGKTTSNPEEYLGSGKYWLNHINKHGKEHVNNLWYCLFYDEQECKEFALSFSHQQNIIESKGWANLINENGTTGGSSILIGKEISKTLKRKYKTGELIPPWLNKPKELQPMYDKKRPEHSRLMSEKMKGDFNPMSGKKHKLETKEKWKENKRNKGEKNGMYGRKGEDNPLYGRKRPQEVLDKMKETRLKNAKPTQIVICPYCNMSGAIAIMKRWHFDKCKFKK